GDGEGQAYVHAGRVELHLGVDERLDPGEVDDRVEVLVRLFPGDAQHRGIEVDVLPAGQVRVEPGTQLEEGGEPTAQQHAAGGRLHDPADHLQQGALAGAVGADEADGAAGVDTHVDVAQRPEVVLVLVGAAEVQEPFLEGLLL